MDRSLYPEEVRRCQPSVDRPPVYLVADYLAYQIGRHDLCEHLADGVAEQLMVLIIGRTAGGVQHPVPIRIP